LLLAQDLHQQALLVSDCNYMLIALEMIARAQYHSGDVDQGLTSMSNVASLTADQYGSTHPKVINLSCQLRSWSRECGFDFMADRLTEEIAVIVPEEEED